MKRILFYLLLLGFAGVAAAAPQVHRVKATMNVQGEKAMVSILFAAEVWEDAKVRGKSLMKKMYPTAKVTSSNFTLTGLVWPDVDPDPNVDLAVVPFYYYSAGEPSAAALGGGSAEDALMNAAMSWSMVSTGFMFFHDESITPIAPSLVPELVRRQKFDGKNGVGWAELEDGVLGVCWSGNSRKTGPEFDIAISTLFTWRTDNVDGTPYDPNDDIFDLETVMLHELGHALGLGHSNLLAVMFPSYSNVNTTLEADDIAGLFDIYGGEAVGGGDDGGDPPPPTVSASVASICYGREGRNQRDLRIHVKVADGASELAGASVSIDLYEILANGSLRYVGSGTRSTSSDGWVDFLKKNAKGDSYMIIVTQIAGQAYDDTPENNSSEDVCPEDHSGGN